MKYVIGGPEWSRVKQALITYGLFCGKNTEDSLARQISLDAMDFCEKHYAEFCFYKHYQENLQRETDLTLKYFLARVGLVFVSGLCLYLYFGGVN